MIRNKEQAALLDLMKRIVKFFDDNDIKYYLFAGSAIGGLRHGGFIPWDNYIDIIMDHDNYYKMLSLSDSLPWDDIEMIGPENSDLYYRPYVQFSNKRDTSFLRSGMYNVGECMGTLIDVMCLDDIPSDKLENYEKDFLIYQEILNDVFTYNKRIGQYRDDYYAAYDRKQEIGKRKLIEELKEEVEKYAAEDCDECVVRFWGRRIRNYKKEWLDDVRYVPFEDMQLPIARKTEACLRLQYGYNWYMVPEAAEQETHNFVVNHELSNNNYFEDLSHFVDWKEARAVMDGRKKSNIEFLNKSIPLSKTNNKIMIFRLIGKCGLKTKHDELIKLYEDGQYDEYISRFDEIMGNLKSFENQKLSDFNVDKNLFCKLMAALVFRGRYYDAEKAARFIFGEKWADEAGQSEEMTFLRSVLDMVEAYQDQEYDLLKERVEIIGEEIGKTIPDYVRAVFALQQNGLVDKSEQELLQLCDGILEIMPENYDVMKVKGDLLAESGREAEAKAHHEKVYYNSRNGLDVLELDRRYSFADRYAIYNEKDL